MHEAIQLAIAISCLFATYTVVKRLKDAGKSLSTLLLLGLGTLALITVLYWLVMSSASKHRTDVLGVWLFGCWGIVIGGRAGGKQQ